MLSQRVPREVWTEMKEAGAYYLSRDDLEEFDMFFSPVGWRYSLSALSVLVRHGYVLRLDGESVEDADQLAAAFSAEGRQRRHERLKAEGAKE